MVSVNCWSVCYSFQLFYASNAHTKFDKSNTVFVSYLWLTRTFSLGRHKRAEKTSGGDYLEKEKIHYSETRAKTEKIKNKRDVTYLSWRY